MEPLTEDDVFKLLREKGRAHNYKSGDFLFKEGNPEDGIFFIDKGSVRILKKNWVLWTADSNELIGISSFFSEGGEYTFSAKASEDSVILKINHNDFQKMLMANDKFGKYVIEMMCERIKFTNSRWKSVMSSSSKSRLIREIITRCNSTKTQNISYTLDELSELVGISKRLVRSILKELEIKNILSRSKENITINDLGALEIILNSSELN